MQLFRMRASTLLLLALPPCLRASWPEGKVHPWHQEIRDAMDAEAGIDRAKEAAARRVVRGDIPILHEFSQKGRFGYNDVKELLEEDGCEMKRSNWLRSGHDTWCTTDGETPPEDAKGLLEDALKMARESNLSATETEAATSALYRIEKQMNETWVDPRAELEDLEVKEEL